MSYCMRCSAWVCRLWLAVVLWSCVVCCVHCNLHTVHTSHDLAPQDHSQPQPTHPVQNTACSRTRPYSPDDGHNDARNMLRKKFDNKYRISCILLVLYVHLMFTMHGHKNIKLKKKNYQYSRDRFCCNQWHTQLQI